MSTTSPTTGRQWRRAPVWVVAISLWAVAGGCLFGAFWSFDAHQRQLFEALRSGSTMTAGVIVSKDTADHDSVEYRYVDGTGHRHVGGDQGEGQEQGDPADLRVGTEITVWYDRQSPSVSCYCTPSLNGITGLYVNEISISQFLVLPFTALASVAYWRWRTGRPSLGQLRRERSERHRAPGEDLL